MNKFNKYYRVSELSELLSIGKSTLWKWVKDGKFPQPIRLSARMTLWSAADIHKWLENHNLTH